MDDLQKAFGYRELFRLMKEKTPVYVDIIGAPTEQTRITGTIKALIYRYSDGNMWWEKGELVLSAEIQDTPNSVVVVDAADVRAVCKEGMETK